MSALFGLLGKKFVTIGPGNGGNSSKSSPPLSLDDYPEPKKVTGITKKRRVRVIRSLRALQEKYAEPNRSHVVSTEAYDSENLGREIQALKKEFCEKNGDAELFERIVTFQNEMTEHRNAKRLINGSQDVEKAHRPLLTTESRRRSTEESDLANKKVKAEKRAKEEEARAVPLIPGATDLYKQLKLVQTSVLVGRLEPFTRPEVTAMQEDPDIVRTLSRQVRRAKDAFIGSVGSPVDFERILNQFNTNTAMENHDISWHQSYGETTESCRPQLPNLETRELQDRQESPWSTQAAPFKSIPT